MTASHVPRQAIKHARSRSHLLHDPAGSPKLRNLSEPVSSRKSRYSRNTSEYATDDDAALLDPFFRILSSPLRRCLLTNKVLPSDMMVRFELTRPQSGAKSLVLEPSRILHPRFDPSVAGQGGHPTGKGMWVTCWSEAVETLARKGSYKRLHSSASTSDPAVVSAKIRSQLARRVVQEAEMLAERVKSWPVGGKGGPISSWAHVPLRVLQHESDIAELDREEEQRVVAILDLSPSAPPAVASDLSASEASSRLDSPIRFATSSSSTPPLSPIYHLSSFFQSAILPPGSLASLRPPTTDPTSSAEQQLLAAMRAPLEGMLALLTRRFEREDPPRARPGPPLEGSTKFALVAPRTPQTEAERTRARVVVPLAVALWRLRLWTGEGWR